MTKWILCNERMPSEHELAGIEHFGITVSDPVLVTIKCDDGSTKVICDIFENGKLQDWPLREGYKRTPIAWKPLPEPYKGETK